MWSISCFHWLPFEDLPLKLYAFENIVNNPQEEKLKNVYVPWGYFFRARQCDVETIVLCRYSNAEISANTTKWAVLKGVDRWMTNKESDFKWTASDNRKNAKNFPSNTGGCLRYRKSDISCLIAIVYYSLCGYLSSQGTSCSVLSRTPICQLRLSNLHLSLFSLGKTGAWGIEQDYRPFRTV